VKKITSFCQVSKETHTEETGSFFASRCTYYTIFSLLLILVSSNHTAVVVNATGYDKIFDISARRLTQASLTHRTDQNIYTEKMKETTPFEN